MFTNTRPLWHPPGARGIFGGGAIAQSLAAAQLTVPSNFTVHSMHCYFVLAGDSEIPILYHVERVRDGRSFATRTVQARQRGKPIFTTTLSFNREGSGGKKLVTHAARKPDLPSPPESYAEVRFRPFETVKLGVMNRTFSITLAYISLYSNYHKPTNTLSFATKQPVPLLRSAKSASGAALAAASLAAINLTFQPSPT